MVINFFIVLPIENCITMTRNALSIEAVGKGPIFKGLLSCSIEAWDEFWSNKVMRRMAWSHQRQISPQHLNSTAWVVGLIHQGDIRTAWSRQRQTPCGTLNSTAWVAL